MTVDPVDQLSQLSSCLVVYIYLCNTSWPPFGLTVAAHPAAFCDRMVFMVFKAFILLPAGVHLHLHQTDIADTVVLADR